MVNNRSGSDGRDRDRVRKKTITVIWSKIIYRVVPDTDSRPDIRLIILPDTRYPAKK